MGLSLSKIYNFLERTNSGGAECCESMALCPSMLSINFWELGKRQH